MAKNHGKKVERQSSSRPKALSPLSTQSNVMDKRAALPIGSRQNSKNRRKSKGNWRWIKKDQRESESKEDAVSKENGRTTSYVPHSPYSSHFYFRIYYFLDSVR